MVSVNSCMSFSRKMKLKNSSFWLDFNFTYCIIIVYYYLVDNPPLPCICVRGWRDRYMISNVTFSFSFQNKNSIDYNLTCPLISYWFFICCFLHSGGWQLVCTSLGMNSSMFPNCSVFCDVWHVRSSILGQNVMFGKFDVRTFNVWSVRSSVFWFSFQDYF